MSNLAERLSFRDGVQFAWDSTSLGLLKECPRKYQYSILWGYAPRAESVHLIFGIHYHKALEVYDHHRAKGLSHEEAIHLATFRALCDTWGWNSDDSYKNRKTLVRSVVWYLDRFGEKDTAETLILANGAPAVELSFRFELPAWTPWGEPYLLSGHLDRLARFGGDLWVMDRKTTKQSLAFNYFDKFNPDNQMSLYTLASRVVWASPVKGVIIDGAQVAVGFTRFQRGFTLRTDDQLKEWLDHTIYFVKQAEGFAAADFWPMNDKACGNYGGCPFRPICAKASSVRKQWLEADYAHRLWDPLAVRGDI